MFPIKSIFFTPSLTITYILIYVRLSVHTLGAASQWWSNERMMVYFKVMMVRYSLMMVKCSSMMVNWVHDHSLISLSLSSISQSLSSIWPSLAWSIPSLAYLTIIEKLHQLPYQSDFAMTTSLLGMEVLVNQGRTQGGGTGLSPPPPSPRVWVKR